MGNASLQNIYISIDENMVSSFFYFLEKGVQKEILVGHNIRTMLSDQLNISEDYIDNRIKTLFLDGSAVGNINSTIINNGATLAISAAMPGLAGATFRRLENTDSFLDTIAENKETGQTNYEKGIITIKFFNLVLRELGPAFLKLGVLIPKDELIKFFSQKSEEFLRACRSVKINGHTSKIEALKQIDIADNAEQLILLHLSY